MTHALEAADLVHLGYALMLCALIARDVLWLRGILVAAQSTLTAYAWLTDRPSMAAWNALFVVINTLWVLRILHERRAVELPPELRRIHERHFAAFSPPEFLRFWSQGEARSLRDRRLVGEGAMPTELLFIEQGEARVERGGGAELVRLPAGSFVAEMSLLTGAPASADVVALGELQLRAWPIVLLRDMRQRQPLLWTRLQSAIGQDLVEKIHRQSGRVNEVQSNA